MGRVYSKGVKKANGCYLTPKNHYGCQISPTKTHTKKLKMNSSKHLDFDPEYYADNSEIQNNLANKLLENYKFHPSASVLDIGCGDGKITAEIAKKIPQGKVIGIDASHNMIVFATNHFPNSEIPNLQFILKRAENLDFIEKFDLIVSFNCFHWIRAWKKTLKLLCSFLKSGGEILMLTYPKENPYYKPFEYAAKYFPQYMDKAACKTLFSTNELKQAFLENGMTFQLFETYKDTVSYQNPTEMKDFVRAWLTSYIPLPGCLHEKFLNLLIKNCASYQEEESTNIIEIPYAALFIHATKT